LIHNTVEKDINNIEYLEALLKDFSLNFLLFCHDDKQLTDSQKEIKVEIMTLMEKIFENDINNIE